MKSEKPTRREFLQTSGATALALTLMKNAKAASKTSTLQSLTEKAHPNVLFLAVDDLNDWIGCMKGHPQAITPNLDRLAARGVLFTNAHCASPVCLPSRTALLCGLRPEQTGVYSNWGKTQGEQPAKDIQLPIHFSRAGYTTLAAGKIHHVPEMTLFDEHLKIEPRWTPFSEAMATYTPEELPSKGTAHPRHVVRNGPGGRDWVLPLNGLPSERNPNIPNGESFDWGPVDVTDDEKADTQITNWAMEKLRATQTETQTKPLLLGVGYTSTHIPLFPPKRDYEAYPPVEEILLPETVASDLDDIGERGRQFALETNTAGSHKLVTQSGQWRQAVLNYLACVTFVDRQIGRLLEALDSSPLADNTWIVLWSDHGWQLGHKQHWGKWTGWRQSTRVPLLIVPPRNQKHARRGQTCAEPVSLLDIYPTLIELCGLSPRDGLAGQSLVPLLADPQKETGRAVVTTFDPGNHALTTRDWRYIRYHNGEEELYHIASDPSEWRNLANIADYQTTLGEMRGLLDEYLRPFVAA